MRGVGVARHADLPAPGAIRRAIPLLPFGRLAVGLHQLRASLRVVTAGSVRHLALVEATRRLYRSHAMAADRADKERALPGGGAFEP